MAVFHDWVKLGKDTFSSIKTKDMTNLYALEWPETRKMLIADYQSQIDNDPRRLRRFVRTRSAMLLGLAKRLAPHRRIAFIFGFLWFFFSLLDAVGDRRSFHAWPFIEMTAAFMIIVVLLAMELIDKIKFRDELELARDLQADLIPKSPPQTNEYEIAAFNRIANTVGGDIYDFVPLPDGRLAVLFGDASGHGMAAGLVMAVAHAAWRTQLDVDPSPGGIISSLNRILERDGTFIATVAGHPQIVKIAGGKVTDRIGAGSYPLGVKTGMKWQELRGSLEHGERLLFHSDGLTEARNANEKEFGDAYVDSIVNWHPTASASTLVETLIGEWNLFTGGRPPEDDVSIAVIARR
jgi:hypothetical protein